MFVIIITKKKKKIYNIDDKKEKQKIIEDEKNKEDFELFNLLGIGPNSQVFINSKIIIYYFELLLSF